MLLLLSLSLLPASAEKLSRREAREAIDAVNGALYHLPDHGVLTWRTDVRFRYDPNPVSCGTVQGTLDLKKQELTTEVVTDGCTDPGAVAALEERKKPITDDLLGILTALHTTPIEQDRRERAWRSGQFTVFLLEDDEEAEFLHVDPETALPAFSQSTTGFTTVYAFTASDDGARLNRGENIRADGTPETRIEFDMVEVAQGVWMYNKVDIYVQGDFVGDARFEDITYTP